MSLHTENGHIAQTTHKKGKTTATQKRHAHRQRNGQLVRLGFDVAVFTPASYQRPRLGRPSNEPSSRGWLRA